MKEHAVHYPGSKRIFSKDDIHDSYRPDKKFSEPTVCPDCKASFQDGRWQWSLAPADAEQHTCPACRRIHDKLPAGYITLRGQFAHSHRKDIMLLIQNIEIRQKQEHPMQRIMTINTTQPDQTIITTTDIHLADAIGRAIHGAFQGDLQTHYNDDDLVRIDWQR